MVSRYYIRAQVSVISMGSSGTSLVIKVILSLGSYISFADYQLSREKRDLRSWKSKEYLSFWTTAMVISDGIVKPEVKANTLDREE
jgi:hypothetical protein